MTPSPKPIFISYSSKHRELTRELAAVLEAQYGAGSVWWDHELESRAAYNTQIRAALDGARVVVVMWTAGAMVSDYVYAEAVRALGDGKLVNVHPADMAFRDIPEPFNIHHIDDAAEHARILGTVAKVMSGTPIPTRVPLHEIYYRQHGQRLIDPKRTALPSASPTMLLQAKYEVVAFSDATGSCAEILAWCTEEPRPAAGRLIHGAGGLGKTRLLIETAARLSTQQGWIAGFLDRPPLTDAAVARQRWQALEQLIHHGDDNGLLIAIDYAEGRQDEVAQLSAAILGAAPQATRPIRLVALARSAGEWWPTLTEENEDVLRLFHRAGGDTDVIALPGLNTSEGRLAFYRHCEAGLAGMFPVQARDACLIARKQEPPTLPRERLDRIAEGTHYDRPLAIQMEALLHLANATPDPPGIDKQLDSVLGLERAHWVKLCGALDSDAKRDMARGVAQVTAVNGVSGRPSAERLLMADGFYAGTRTAPVHVDPVYRRLAAVYGAKNGALLALEPDLIGEHHVAATADNDLTGGCLAWIDAEPEESRAERRSALLTVLQRATRAEHGVKADKAVALLDHLVVTARAPLAADMVAVMVDTPGRLEAVLGKRVARTEDFDTLAVLHDALPLASLALMDLSLAVAERLVTIARRQIAALDAMGEQDGKQTLASLARLGAALNTLGVRLSALGRREEALAAMREAVETYRRLAEARSDAFLPDLAMCLNNLGNRLSDLGRREEALAATREAVETYRRLAEARPDAFLPDLAMNLSNLGAMLSDLGRREEPLAATREAVEIYRRLTEARPDAFLPDLARGLTGLGAHLSDLGRREEALAATREAVEIYRRQAEARPDAFLPDLAASLNNLGMMLSNLGRREEALAATREAVEIRRRLTEARPDAFLPDLAASLNNLGMMLSNLGRHEEALAATREAVEIYRRQAEARPDAFLPNLAMSLSNLGTMLSNLGRREEALAATREAVEIRRRLAEARPDAFLPDLATSLGAMGHAHLTAEQYLAAVAAFEKGLMVIAPFVECHSQAFGDLARNLGRDYFHACEKAVREPDTALLERIARALGIDAASFAEQPALPDDAVRQLMAHPNLQEALTAILRENNLEGTPADRPIETQRALAAAFMQAMAGANGADEPATANEPAPTAAHTEQPPAPAAMLADRSQRAPAPTPEPPAAARPKRGWWPFRCGT